MKIKKIAVFTNRIRVKSVFFTTKKLCFQNWSIDGVKRYMKYICANLAFYKIPVCTWILNSMLATCYHYQFKFCWLAFSTRTVNQQPLHYESFVWWKDLAFWNLSITLKKRVRQRVASLLYKVSWRRWPTPAFRKAFRSSWVLFKDTPLSGLLLFSYHIRGT